MLRHRCRVNRTTLMTQRVGWVEPLRYPSPLHAPSKMMGFASAQPILRALPQAWLWLHRSLNRPAGWGTPTRLELFAFLPHSQFARPYFDTAPRRAPAYPTALRMQLLLLL